MKTLRRYRLRTLVALGLSFILVLAACGDDDTSTTTSTTSGGDGSSTTVTTAGPTTSTTTGPATSTTSGATTTTQSEPPPPQPLVVGWSTFGNEALSPVTLSTSTQDLYLDAMFDYLVYIERDVDAFQVVPGLATSYETSDGGTTWTFRLRDDATFSNGDAVTAEDVRFSFELYMSDISTAPRAGFLRSTIAGMNVEDDHTIVFSLSNPVADFPIQISDLHSNPILPSAYIQEVGHDQFALAPIGSGPYEFESQQLGSFIRMTARDSHWRADPVYSSIEFRLLEEPGTRLSALQSREVDVIDLPLDLAPQVDTNEFDLVDVPFAINEWINFGAVISPDNENYDPNSPQLNPLVREAMSIAIDREALVQALYAGRAVPASVAFWLPGTLGFENGDLPVPEYNPVRARQLLADAGYPDGFSIELHVFDLPPATQLTKMGEAVAQMWAEIGIDATVVPTSFANIRDAWTARTLTNAAWPMRLAKFPDLTQTLPIFFKSDGGLPTANSAELDAMVDSILAEPDPGARSGLMRALVEKVANETLAIPVVYSSAVLAKSNGIGNWPVFPGLGYKISYAFLRPAG